MCCHEVSCGVSWSNFISGVRIIDCGGIDTSPAPSRLPPPLTTVYTLLHIVQMVRDQRAAEEALVRYYNSASARSKGKKQYGPLWEALAMVKAGFDVTTTPYLQVLKYNIYTYIHTYTYRYMCRGIEIDI